MSLLNVLCILYFQHASHAISEKFFAERLIPLIIQKVKKKGYNFMFKILNYEHC